MIIAINLTFKIIELWFFKGPWNGSRTCNFLIFWIESAVRLNFKNKEFEIRVNKIKNNNNL